MQKTKNKRGIKVAGKTKQIRVLPEDAFIIEQASRELSAEMQKEVTVSEVFKELAQHVPEAAKRVKEEANKISKK